MRCVRVKVTERDPESFAQYLLPHAHSPPPPLAPNKPCFIKITKRKEIGNICFLGKVKENNDPCKETAGRLGLLGKGLLCFIVPGACLKVWRELCIFRVRWQAMQYL